MKKLMLFAAVLMAISSCMGQPTQRKSPHDTVSNATVKITYGRPHKNGRVIFGNLEKYGKVWRTGADEATEITFTKDGTLGGKPVKAGTYTLFTIPGEQSWNVILNSELKQWGAFGYEGIKGKDVLNITVPAQKTSSTVEQMTITLNPGNFVIAWDDTQITVPYKV